MSKFKLVAPCTYQGAKQRLRKEIIDIIFENEEVNGETKFFDLCCGTGNITLELLGREIRPNNITMLDASSWGVFWKLIGEGLVDINKFEEYLNSVPKDKHQIQGYLKDLSKKDARTDEAYRYLFLQAGAFGGKQIWKEGNEWKKTSFRSYWQPTETSIRRSPVNPMQPMPDTIKNRFYDLLLPCKGLNVIHDDIFKGIEKIKESLNGNSIVYIDPPYIDTTGYGFSFDWKLFVNTLKREYPALPIYVSEGKQYSEQAIRVNFNGAKGGISGTRTKKQEEWLNIY